MAMSPWLDCPTCPKCDLPVAIADHEAGPLGLFCPACGERWNGTQEDRAIADRSDLAWHNLQRRRTDPKKRFVDRPCEVCGSRVKVREIYPRYGWGAAGRAYPAR